MLGSRVRGQSRVFGWFWLVLGVWWGVCAAVGYRLWVLVVLSAGFGRVWFDGWVPSVWDGSGLVYGGARVGVGVTGWGIDSYPMYVVYALWVFIGLLAVRHHGGRGWYHVVIF